MADQLSLENSPLEIYETAYRLHYIDNRISEAVKYYEILIKDFPDSNECGYAAVQIQKIKANGLIKELNKSGRSIHPIALLAFILSIICMTSLAIVTYYSYSRYTIERNRVKLALTALAKIHIGDDDEAMRVLTELKITDKKDLLPFELSSDIYRKQGHYDQARSEYEIYFRLNPELKPTPLQFTKMKPDTKHSDLINNSLPAKPVNSLNQQQTSPEKLTIPPQKPVAEIKNKKPNTPQRQKKIKSLFLVDPDSISYF